MRAERGIGLPEFIVAIFLVGVLSTLVVTFYVTINRNFSQERAATDSTMVAAAGMKEVSRVIRSGTEIPELNKTVHKPVFLEAGPERVLLYTYLDTDSIQPKPTLVLFSIDASTRVLTESRWNSTLDTHGYWNFPAATTTPDYARPIARKIVETAAGPAPLFTYLGATSSALTLPAGGEKNLGKLRTIAAVTVTMTVQADEAKHADPVTLQNTVGIPNRGISRVGP